MSNGSFSQAGFYYQNNVATLKILGLLDLNTDVLDISLENYDKGKHIDDIILNKKDQIEFYQVKWSNEVTNSYTIHNIAFQIPEGESKSLWKKLADGYASKVTGGKKASIILYSPRQASNSKLPSKSINKGLKELIAFQNVFQSGENISIEQVSKYDQFKPVLDKLKDESGLSQKDFNDFFKTLQLNLNAPELEYIKLQIKNKADQLGLDNTQIEKLLNLVVEWSISGVAVTKDLLLANLGIKDRFVDRLSQIFKVDESNYVEDPALFAKLDAVLGSINNGYVFIEGVPGSGKSTALTKYAARNKQIRFAYYCFIPDETTTTEARLKSEYFLKSLCIAIEKSFPDVNLPIPYSDNYEDKLAQYFEKISGLGEKIIFLIDGLDHVDRNRDSLYNPLTNNILSTLPDNLIVIVSSQYIEALPLLVRAEIISNSKRYIKISRFSETQVRSYLQKKYLLLSDEQVTSLLKKSEGLPLYLRYITSFMEDTLPKDYDSVINEFPVLTDSKINTYHALLFHKIEKDTIAKWILSLLANRKEYTSIEVIKTILKNAGVLFDTLQINQSLKAFKHLLKEKDGEYFTIFHNSFREFIIINTKEIRDDLNLALIKYYEEDIFQEEAFRNYFSHLFYLKRYQSIIDIVTESWINESWKKYKTIVEISENINIAWNACAQIESISEFVRIAFLKHQVNYAGYNLSSGSFEESIYFLDGGLNKESLRAIWDGEFSLVSNEDFFNHYAIKYFEQTSNAIPFSIATQFFNTFLAKATVEKDQLTHPQDRNDFGAYLKAISLYVKPQELIEELKTLAKNISIDDVKSFVQFLEQKNKLGYILELWQVCVDGPLKNYILSELLLGLYNQKSSDVINYENKFSFDELEQDEKINFLEKIIPHVPEEKIVQKYKHISIKPFSDEAIISTDYNYKLKPEFLNLLQSLKVFYFLDETNYTAFDLKISPLLEYPRNLYFAISSCAKSWADYIKKKPNASLQDGLKKIIDYLTIPKYLASLITSEHGAKSFIQYEIHRINKMVFECFNEIASDNDLKQIIPYWLKKHEKNGFYDYRSDLAFADVIITRTNLKEEITDLIKHSETLARQSHDTYGLVESLTMIGRAFGKAGRKDDYNRIYHELLSIACGVSYRKDYQFANIFSVLEEAHKLHPGSTLQRLADNYYLLFKLKDAGNPRMLHICLSELIGLIIKYYPQLAFEILTKDDMFLGRDEALDIVLNDIIPSCDDAFIPYIWAIIKTKNKWEDFGRDDDHNVFGVYKDFFTRLLKYSDTEFIKTCYLYLYRQFTVEQNIPLKILKINKILTGSGNFYEFIKVPVPTSEPVPKNQRHTEPTEKEKPATFARKVEKLDVHDLSELAAQDIKEIEDYILRHQETNQFNLLRPSWVLLYKNSTNALNTWFATLSPDLQLLVEKNHRKCTRLFLETLNAIVKQRKIRTHLILKSVNQLIDQIQDLLPGTKLKLYIESEIDLSTLLKPLYQNIPRSDFTAEYVMTDKEMLELLSSCHYDKATQLEDLIVKYYDKPVIVQAYLNLSKKTFIYDQETARTYLAKAFRVAESISYHRYEWESELLKWAYTCFPEKANYFVLRSFYAEHIDRQGELIYDLFKKVRPWEGHFSDSNFYETYYQANYQYNAKLAEGLPDPEVDISFILNHHETTDFQTSAQHYLIDLFDYPVVKIRHLAMESIFHLYPDSQQVFHDFTLIDLKNKSPNLIEHFLIILYSLSVKHTSKIGELINNMGWIFQFGHYNIQESFADLVKFHLAKGTQIQCQLAATAEGIHKKPIFPQTGILRPLQHKSNFALSWYQNTLIREIDEAENAEDSFSDELYTLLIEEGYDETNAKQTEAQVHRNYTINSNFDTLEINGPVYKTIQNKINRLFLKHIQQGYLENSDISQLKYEFRICDPTDQFALRVSKPDYILWKGNNIDEKKFIQFLDIDELIENFLTRGGDFITLFEKGYQRIDSYPASFSQYFEIVMFLVEKNVSKKRLETILTKYNSYLGHSNVYRTEMTDYFLDIDELYKIQGAIYPLLGISDKYFRHKLEDSLAILLPHISIKLEITPVPNSLNFENKDKLQVVEFIEWQDPFKDHDRRRFEPLSQGCTLNANRSLLQKYITEKKMDVYISLTLRRSVDKYKSESEMKWVEKSFLRSITV